MKTVDVENTRFLYFTGKKVYENCTDKYRCQIYCQLYTRQNVEIFLLRLFVFLSNISTYAFAKLAALDYKVIREMNVQKNIYINIFRSIIVILEYTESKFHRITELRLVWAINVHTAKKKNQNLYTAVLGDRFQINAVMRLWARCQTYVYCIRQSKCWTGSSRVLCCIRLGVPRLVVSFAETRDLELLTP